MTTNLSEIELLQSWGSVVARRHLPTTKVTGLIISNNAFGVGKKKYKDIRAKVHHLVLKEEQTNVKLFDEVRGWLSYLKSVDEKRFSNAKAYIKILAKKYPGTLVERLSLSRLIEAL